MSNLWKCRHYIETDYDSCLHVFDSAGLFTENERADFKQLLSCTDPLKRCWGWKTSIQVVEDTQESIVGCGVICHDCHCRFHATISWVIVDACRQRQGIGRFLLLHLLASLAAIPEVDMVDLHAAPATKGFYEKFGFNDEGVWEDHFGAGLHSHHMEIKFKSENRKLFVTPPVAPIPPKY